MQTVQDEINREQLETLKSLYRTIKDMQAELHAQSETLTAILETAPDATFEALMKRKETWLSQHDDPSLNLERTLFFLDKFLSVAGCSPAGDS